MYPYPSQGFYVIRHMSLLKRLDWHATDVDAPGASM